MLIRTEIADDVAAISRVHAAAFGDPGFRPADDSTVPVEVALVEALRQSDAWLRRLALVAVVAGEVVGHVVCTRATLGPAAFPVLGLGPIGVTPEHQRRGVGAALMHSVIAAADACDEPLIGLLGDPGYYRRFCFAAAADLGIEAPDPDWGEYFQARRLSSHPPGLQGRFRYAPPFDGL